MERQYLNKKIWDPKIVFSPLKRGCRNWSFLTSHARHSKFL